MKQAVLMAKEATLLGKVSLQKRNTIYTRFGNWFEITILIAALCFGLLSGKKQE